GTRSSETPFRPRRSEVGETEFRRRGVPKQEFGNERTRGLQPRRRIPMTLRVTLIQGGGIGLDQVPAVRRILEAAGVRVEWEEYLAGLAAVQQALPPLSPELLDSVRLNGLALKNNL